MKKYCVYRHIRNDNGTTFYVGKGLPCRPFDKSKRNIYWKRITSKIGFTVEILIENLTESQAFDEEVKFIKKYKSIGMCDANLINGGEGASGRILSNESRIKLSKSRKGIYSGCNHYNFGKKMSDSVKKKISNSLRKSNKHPWRGHRLGENIRLKMVESSTKKKQVMCLDTGVVYDSASSAARILSLRREHISAVARGKLKTTGKLRFIYV